MNKKAISIAYILLLTVTFNSPGENVQYVMQAVQDGEPVSTGESKKLNMKAYNWGFRYAPVEIRRGDQVKITVESTEGIHGLNFSANGNRCRAQCYR